MRNKAFLAMPYRDDLRWIRNAIAAACRKLGIELISVDEQVPAGDIIAAIHHHIRSSDFGYVVLTGLNPNVMYELGLLHQAAKPTVIIADSETAVPFDLRSAMRLQYDSASKNESKLADQIAAATGQLTLLFDHAVRGQLALGGSPSDAGLTTEAMGASVSIAEFDFEQIKERSAKAVGRKSCVTNNIVVLDEDEFRGWRLKARCSGGATIIIKIDLNGEAAEIDVQE